MNCTRYAVGIAILGLGLAGCTRPAAPARVAVGPATTPAATRPNPNPPTPQPPRGGVGGGIDLKRVIQKADAMNQLRNIAQMYVSYGLENGKPPASKKDFMEYLKSSAPKEYRSLEEDYFTIVAGAQSRGDTVIAYEKNADRSGSHLVAKGDGSVDKMNTQELKTALGMK